MTVVNDVLLKLDGRCLKCAPYDLIVQPTKRYSVVSSQPLELFVPGRICLFGEHSDWCCEFPADYAPKVGGAALVSATSMGIFARCKRIRDGRRVVYFRSHIFGSAIDRELPLDEEQSRKSAADPTNILSYVEGTISRFLSRFPCIGSEGSIEIDNYKTTLPLRKGLSSSAAICVVTVRALSILLLDKQLSAEEEMQISYEGERLTPSLCGKLDQICAKLSPGQVGRLSFRKESSEILIQVEEILVPQKPVRMVIVNLAGNKDTIKILSALRDAAVENKNKIRDLFGKWNYDTVQEAARVMKDGSIDAEALGELAIKAQFLFDNYALPMCPSELTAPALHELLKDPNVVRLSSGGKSVGAGGDGTALLFAATAEKQQSLLDYVSSVLGLEAWATTL